MKKVGLLLYVCLMLVASLLNASEMVNITREELVCLIPKIDRYLDEQSDPVHLILESKCQKGEVRKRGRLDFDTIKHFPEDILELDFKQTKCLPRDILDVNKSNDSVKPEDIVSLSKASLKHIKKHAKEWLDSNTSSWEIPKL